MSNRSKNAKKKPGSVTIDDMLCFALYSAGHSMGRVYKPLLDPLGLTYPQYLAMVALWGEDDRTVGGLGTTLQLESNTLTPLLKRLEGLRFVQRRRDDADERQVRVRLTAAGRALEQKAKDIPRCVLEASGLTIPALERLRTELSVLRDRLLAQ